MRAPPIPEQESVQMAADMSGPTVEMVETAVREFHDANPAKTQATVEDIVEVLDPTAAAMVKSGQMDLIVWAESVSNILKDLGRNGRLTVTLVPDQRGYDNPVVRF